MSAYLKSLVQRAASTRATAAVGPVRTAASLGELSWRPAMRPATEAVVPSKGSEVAAAASGADVAGLWSRFTAFVAAVPVRNKLQPPHVIHKTVHLPERAAPAVTSQEIRPTTPVSALPQSMTDTSRQQTPAVSLEVSSPPCPAPAPTKVSAEWMAEHEMVTPESGATNTRPRTASPLPSVNAPEKTRRGTGKPEVAASTISTTVPAEFVRPRGQSVSSVPETPLVVTAQTASIDAPRHSETKPVRARMKTVAPQTIIPAAAPALRLPPTGPTNRSGQGTGEVPPSMQVRIGRVEVRAVPAQEAPAAAAPASTGARGFDDYISLRAYARDNY